MSKKPRKRKNSRAKGGNAEREIAKLLGEWWKAEFARTPMSGGFATKSFRNDWSAEGDISTPDKTFPFSVEVKRREGWTLDHILTAEKSPIWEWWQQAVDQSSDTGRQPLLIFRRNHQPWMYMLFLEPGIHANGKKLLTEDHKGRQIVIGLMSDLTSTSKKTFTNRVRSK